MHSPWAKLYGIGFGLISIVMAACVTPDLPANARSELTIPTATTTKKTDKDLSRAERVRAIAARGRTLRRTRVPEERIVREFDATGVLKHEFVWGDTAWVERPGTLPRDYGAQPLAGFLSSPLQAAMFTGDSVISGEFTSTIYDSIIAQNAVATTTATLNFSTGVAITSRDSYDTNLLSVSELVSSTPSGVGNIDAMVGGVVTTVLGEGYIEVSISGGDFSTALTIAKGMLPSELYTPASYRATARPDISSTAGVQHAGFRSMASSAATAMAKLNCNGHLVSMGVWMITGALIAICGAGVLAGVTVSAALAAVVGGGIGTAVVGSLAEAVLYALCEYAGGPAIMAPKTDAPSRSTTGAIQADGGRLGTTQSHELHLSVL